MTSEELDMKLAAYTTEDQPNTDRKVNIVKAEGNLIENMPIVESRPEAEKHTGIFNNQYAEQSGSMSTFITKNCKME
ncbi:Hypothetical predicted protein [Pelobates cultripes]|uniref:Uncharacterized protein n=1 Tax=Pelobates cultripes TaxID=61616 RepID=A0AAD1SMY9_PELCU|nr:Hypothetical predicted protein [Pelobates cultripes]